MSIEIPLPGDVWQHHEGAYYEVIGTANDLEAQQQRVICRSEDGLLVSLSLRRWATIITLKGGQQVQRFTFVSRTIDQVERLPHDDTQPAPPACTPVKLDTEVVFQ